ncbi:MAG: SpoIID/LytB domain-containing protein [Elusimicrobiota bacterium]|nr:SpoIID/LytB domain-containing protein [Elusimicrobiota bacterium]
MKNIVLSVLFLFAASSIYAAPVANSIVKIGVIVNTNSANIGASANFSISDAKGKKLNLSKGLTRLSYSGGVVSVENNKLTLPLRVESDRGLLYANKTAYRGYFLIVKSQQGGIAVINVLKLEDYLKGVVPRESDAKWPIETLKSQSVISRTYTLANLGKHSAQGFDLCAQTHCQVYGGASAESPLSNEAVSETANQVLTYNGKYAQTVFHANCAGHTENPRYVWGWTDVPKYLEGVKCGFCKDAPYSQWETLIEEDFIRRQLLKTEKGIGEILEIKPEGKTPGGSAIEVIVKHTKGEIRLNAYRFRLLTDAWKIKSNTFKEIKKTEGSFYFSGFGWGHKVGLCQWGARGMGLDGKTHNQILQFYYPGTEIEIVKYRN